MFARSAACRGPARAGRFGAAATSSRVDSAVAALLDRMRQRQYPETTPVLASYWLKTIWNAGHNLPWWKCLNDLLARSLKQESLNDFSREALIDIQRWVQQTVLATGHTNSSCASEPDAVETNLEPGSLLPYVTRLLNEWLPAEVARLLVTESELHPEEIGIPVLAIGKAIENLLVRARLSTQMLEMLLSPELLSPRCVYPAHAEMLRDVALSLLGKAEAPPYPIMPAILLCLAQHSPLSAGYGAAVAQASLVRRPDTEEIHVPIGPEQAKAIVTSEQVRIGSVIVTMDGRWWESRSLQTGPSHSVVHVPAGRFRIDDSADHAKLMLPCMDAHRQWFGEAAFPETFEIFGRVWRVTGWEQDGEHSWVHLIYDRNLRVDEIAPAAAARTARLRPASVDMAWSALGDALAAALEQKSQEPIERLYHGELIPFGRALCGLMEAVARWRWRKDESAETHLRAVRYFASQLSPEYGLAPWRIVPEPVRPALLRVYHEKLPELFEGTPPGAGAEKKSAGSRPVSPLKAA